MLIVGVACSGSRTVSCSNVWSVQPLTRTATFYFQRHNGTRNFSSDVSQIPVPTSYSRTITLAGPLTHSSHSCSCLVDVLPRRHSESSSNTLWVLWCTSHHILSGHTCLAAAGEPDCLPSTTVATDTILIPNTVNSPTHQLISNTVGSR